MSMCSLILRTLVSLCMWSIGVVLVLPRAVRSALFCSFCSLSVFVCDRWVAKAVLQYSIVGLRYCLYSLMFVSFFCPKSCPVMALSALSLGVHFRVMSAM